MSGEPGDLLSGRCTGRLPKPRLLFILKGPNFYRCALLDSLAEEFDLTVVFTTRPDEVAARKADHFGSLVHAQYRWDMVRGVQLGRFKVAPRLPAALREDYDCVVVGLLDDVIALQCMEYLGRRGRRFVLSVDGIGRRNTALDLLFSRYVRRAALCLSPSHQTDDFLRELSAPTVRLERYVLSSVFRHEVDERVLDHPEKLALRARLGLGTELPTLVSVGQVVPRKGFDVLIDAMSRIERPCSVVIVGGRATPELLDLTSRAGTHEFTFVEHATRAEIGDYYRMADVFALATRGDSWGLVVPEAMSHGLPVVTTTACGAGVELVDAEGGRLVPPDDAHSLASALRLLLDDPELASAMAMHNLGLARGLTVEAMNESCHEAIRQGCRLTAQA